jgi:hypothetical protein
MPLPEHELSEMPTGRIHQKLFNPADPPIAGPHRCTVANGKFTAWYAFVTYSQPQVTTRRGK